MARGFKPGPIHSSEPDPTFDEAMSLYFTQVSDILTRAAEVAEGQRRRALANGWSEEYAMEWAQDCSDFMLESIKPHITGT